MPFLLAKEGLSKNAREDYYDKVQSVNRYVIGNLILAKPSLMVIRRELKKLADNVKIDVAEIEQLLKNEVIKREIVEGDEATTAQSRINKFYKKSSKPRKKKTPQSDSGSKK